MYQNNQTSHIQPAHTGPGMVEAPGAVKLAFPYDYQSGLCGCFSDCPVCLEGWCCTWCQAGFQANKMNTGRGGDMDIPVCASTCLLDFFCVRGLAIACYTGIKGRTDINRRFGIPESTTVACLKGCCCPSCSTCQQQREMKARNFAGGGICDKTVHHGPPIVAEGVSQLNPYAQQPQHGHGGPQPVAAPTRPTPPTWPYGQPVQGQPIQYGPPADNKLHNV